MVYSKGMKKHTGFTLIELLVVIAIVGILAVVIIASLGQSRIKAKDAAILTEMNQLATAVEAETEALGDYTDVCSLFDSGNELADLKDSIINHGGIWESCADDAVSYAVVVTLNAQQAYNPFGVKEAYARANVTLCHAPGTDAQETISTEGWYTDFHRDHGDTEGPCTPTSTGGNTGFSGVHSHSESLLSPEDIKQLRDAEGSSFVEPRYYCIGAVPPHVEGENLRKGYLYTIPEGGCGSPAPSFAAAQTAYGNRE
jgi:prepilin-type N-terminal cleavage/methylation domain-containing protein